MPTSITITLPWPDRALSPNAGKRSMWPSVKARKAYRRDAKRLWGSERVKLNRKPCIKCGHARRLHGATCEVCACDGYDSGSFIPPPVVADITFTYTVERARDEDNHIAMLKPVWDGAKDAGVIVDDNADVFSIGSVKFERGKERGVTVVLTSRGEV